MAKTYAGKQWGNDQSNALDAPDYPYLATKRVGFLAAEASTYTAVAGVFTPDGVVANVAARIAASQSVLVNGTIEHNVASVNSSTFTVSDANAAFSNATIRESILLAPQSPIVSNTQPSGKGWEIEHPWAGGAGAVSEVLVAIGGLKMPAPTIKFLQSPSAPGHTATEPLKLIVQFDQGVVVTDANVANVWIVAIGSNSSVANVNLVYTPADSMPQSGVLAFEATPDLHLDLTGETLTINSTSTFRQLGAIKSYKKKSTALVATAGLTGFDNVATGALVWTLL